MFMHSKKGSQLRFKAKIFNALSDSTRLEALEFLHATEKCVRKMIPHVGLIQPVVSRACSSKGRQLQAHYAHNQICILLSHSLARKYRSPCKVLALLWGTTRFVLVESQTMWI